MHSTNKIIIFILILTSVVALLLAGLFFGLKDRVAINEEVYNKKATLTAIEKYLDKPVAELSKEEVLEIFSKQMTQKVVDTKGNILSADDIKSLGYPGGKAEAIDMGKERKKNVDDRVWPLYEFNSSDNKKFYIISARGLGLWDEIWGVIALEDDLKTIAGVGFDHKAETPGLGAEIKDSKAFQEQFIGKSILDSNGDYRGIKVMKGGVRDATYQVDGISGATITADGVSAMFDLAVKSYEPYLKSIKN